MVVTLIADLPRFDVLTKEEEEDDERQDANDDQPENDEEEDDDEAGEVRRNVCSKLLLIWRSFTCVRH